MRQASLVHRVDPEAGVDAGPPAVFCWGIMAKCDLFVEMERTSVPLGGTVDGAVAVEVNKDCPCKGLTVEFGWRTHSRARTVKGTGTSAQLYEGEWKQGEQVRYPFSLPVSPGPCSYSGRLLSVVWTVRARADIPWAIDPKAEQTVTVEPGPVDSYNAGPAYRPPKPGAGISDGWLLIRNFGIAGVLIAVVMVALHGMMSTMVSAVVAGVVLLIAAVVSLGVFRRMLAKRKLGKPEVTIEPQVVSPGQSMLVTLKLSPARAIELNAATATLRGVEKIVYSETYHSGGKTHTRRVTRKEEVVSIEEPVRIDQQALAAGEPATVGTALDVPDLAPPTFSARDNEIYWVAELHIDIAHWPDWKRVYQVAVVPGPDTKPPAPLPPPGQDVPGTPPAGPAPGGGPVITGDGRILE